MITSFGNKVAKDLWEKDSAKGINGKLAARGKILLTIIHNTRDLTDVLIEGEPPGLRLHKMHGEWKGFWSITILKENPLRILFKYKDGEFSEIQIVDPH